MGFNIGDLIARVGADITGFRSAMSDVSSTADKTAKNVEGSSGKIANAFLSLAPKLTAAGIGAFILNAGRDFQNASAQIARSSGEVGDNLAALNASFRNLYATSGRSAEEIAGGLARVRVETKLSGKELEALTAVNLKFAKVVGSDVGSAVDQTQILFQNWSISTVEQSDKLDVLYATMTKAGMGMSDLTAQMVELGPTARSFGLSFDQTAALVGAFDDAGLKAADMVRGLNALFLKFSASGKDPQQALKELIDRLKDTKTQAAAVNELIEAGFAKRSAVAMADAARRGALEIADLVKELEKSRGKVAEVAEASKTFGDRWKELQHQLELAAEPAGNFIVKWAADGIAQINKLHAILGAVAGIVSGRVKPLPPDAGDYVKNLPAPIAPPSAGGGAGGGGDANPAGSFFIAQAVSADQAADAVNRAKESIRAYMDALGGLKPLSIEVWSDMSSQVLDFSVLVEAAGPILAEMVEIPAKAFDDALSPAIRESEAAMHSLGIASTRELRAQYDAAMRATEAMIANGASVYDVGEAMEKVAELHKKVAERTGQWDSQTTKATKNVSMLARQVSTVFTDLSRSLADVVMGTKKFGDAFKDVGKAIVRIILEDIIANAFGKLVKFLKDTVLPHLGAVGKAIGGILGGGASAAGSAAGAAGGAASGVGSAASGVGSAASSASSGIMGIIGLGAQVASAISSVIGNFQMHGMNEALNSIDKNTLVTAVEMQNLRADEWTREGHYMHKLDDMWNSIRDIGKGNGATFDFRGSTFGGGMTQSSVNQMFQIAYQQALAKVGA